MKQPHAPRPVVVLCRVCGKPDYLEGLCYVHYAIEHKRHPYYSPAQQDADRLKHETKDCGCPRLPEDYHQWDCDLNTMAEVGQEHIFDGKDEA